MDVTDGYRILGSDVILRFPSQEVAGIIRHILGGFASPHVSPVSPYEIQTGPEENAYRIVRSGTVLSACGSLSSLARRLEWTVLHAAIQRMPCLGLHAGAVTRGGRTLLLPGTSGAGKTTLVLGLLLRGWTLLSDEVVPVRSEDSRVRPFPRALWIKGGSLDLFLSRDARSSLLPPEAVRELNGALCVAGSRFAGVPPERPFSVDWIVFPAYCPGNEVSLERLSPGRGLALLLECAFNRKTFSVSCLETLGRLVEEAPCFRLRSGALQPALDLLNECTGTAE